jgi:hypothetical protein
MKFIRKRLQEICKIQKILFNFISFFTERFGTDRHYSMSVPEHLEPAQRTLMFRLNMFWKPLLQNIETLTHYKPKNGE